MSRFPKEKQEPVEEEEKCSRKAELWVGVSAVSLVVHPEEVTSGGMCRI